MKSEFIKQEYDKLKNIFEDCEESQKTLIQGLIEQAAYLYGENKVLQKLLETTGMIKIHPKHPDVQKTIPAAKEYRANAAAYATIIKTLNQIMNQNVTEGDDPFEEWLKERNKNRQKSD